MASKEAQQEQLSQGDDPKFLVGVAVSVYQNSGAYLLLGIVKVREGYSEALISG